uniref:Uncharacterized protein n=1 Tax=Sphaerodactylus townsendi TaxID=933632 RepID=A0ACB8F531_9SAUR
MKIVRRQDLTFVCFKQHPNNKTYTNCKKNHLMFIVSYKNIFIKTSSKGLSHSDRYLMFTTKHSKYNQSPFFHLHPIRTCAFLQVICLCFHFFARLLLEEPKVGVFIEPSKHSKQISLMCEVTG